MEFDTSLVALFLTVAHSPNSLGEALSVFRFFLVAFGFCTIVSLFGLCPFGNKFLIIQKKKNNDESSRFNPKFDIPEFEGRMHADDF